MENKKIFVIGQPEVVDTVGGAITIFNNFCNLLASNNYDVYAICYTNKEGYPKGLNDKVKFHNLRAYYEKDYNYDEALNKFIEEKVPDLIVFFYPYLYAYANLKSIYNNIPRILMFHSRPDYYFTVDCELTKNLEQKYVNTISQVLFDNYRKLLPSYINQNETVCIPNAAPEVKCFVNTKVEHKKIIYLSRIDCFKGLEFLINSFKLIAKKYPDWSIDIYGQSQPETYVENLINLVKKLKLENQIYFRGITKKPTQTMLNYDFCVFPSYFEGFPVGLIESQSVGLPCIGLKKCSGVNELIIDNYNGFLTDDSHKNFAKKIEILINDINLRTVFSKNALENVKKYEWNKINELWLKIVEDILENKDISINVFFDSVNKNVEYFPIKKIINMAKMRPPFLQRLLSINNVIQKGKKRKIIYFLGIKIVLK